MARIFISGGMLAVLEVFVSARPGHGRVLRTSALFEQAFSDSGFWDYALLHAYDTAVQKVVVYGITSISEMGWTERAALTIAGALGQGSGAFSLSSIKGAGSIFFILAQNYALVISGAVLVLASGGWLGF